MKFRNQLDYDAPAVLNEGITLILVRSALLLTDFIDLDLDVCDMQVISQKLFIAIFLHFDVTKSLDF